MEKISICFTVPQKLKEKLDIKLEKISLETMIKPSIQNTMVILLRDWVKK